MTVYNNMMSPKKESAPAPSSRLLALDYLRGFFICVIIIDHVWRWPSLLGLFSGEGSLWVSAAEGFVMISGLLIGYVRGYKNRELLLRTVSFKVLRRALLLYLWLIIASLGYVLLTWYLPVPEGVPWVEIEKGHWSELFTRLIMLDFKHVWVHFLYLYTIFLAVTPLAIALLRRRLWWLVALISLGGFVAGQLFDVEWLQWQALFFLPSIAGFYLTTIQAWWRSLSGQWRRTIQLTIGGITAITIAFSVWSVFYADDNPLAPTLDNIFLKDPFTLWRMLLAFIWFVAFIFLFEKFRRGIARFFGWLLLPFGTRSLTAYIIHGVPIYLLTILIPYTAAGSPSIILNTSAGLACIVLTWLLMQTWLVKRFIPK